jgi:oligopeptide/dipeptide ABC transporter ATP-binding protein
MNDAVISIRDLEIQFRSAHGNVVRAVDGVSLDVLRGETLGLVGESGCGKTTLARAIIGLVRASKGKIRIGQLDVARLARIEKRLLHRQVQMIFQDPYSSLDPRMSVAQILSEPIHSFGLTKDVAQRVVGLMETVGLDRTVSACFPHELSGGQRQRIAIGRALAVEPEIVIADEPFGALDVSIQAQIMNLLADLQDRFMLTYLVISHDLRAVRYLSDRLAVMYMGKVVELGPARDVLDRPLAPYTRALTSALPILPQLGSTFTRKSEVGLVDRNNPSPTQPISGCSFRMRCPYAIGECADRSPTLQEILPMHYAACSRITPDRPDIASIAPNATT